MQTTSTISFTALDFLYQPDETSLSVMEASGTNTEQMLMSVIPVQSAVCQEKRLENTAIVLKRFVIEAMFRKTSCFSL